MLKPLCLFRSNFLFILCHNAVLMLWLGLGTEPLGLGKQNVCNAPLTNNQFGHHKNGWKCLQVSLNISSGVTLTPVLHWTASWRHWISLRIFCGSKKLYVWQKVGTSPGFGYLKPKHDVFLTLTRSWALKLNIYPKESCNIKKCKVSTCWVGLDISKHLGHTGANSNRQLLSQRLGLRCL